MIAQGNALGSGSKLESQALKGRNDGTQRARRDEVGVGHRALSGLGFLMGDVVPGRCPGLSHYAPLGRKTGAVLIAIKRAIVDTGCNRSHPLPSGGRHQEDLHRLATRGYVGWNRSHPLPSGGHHQENLHRLATRGYGRPSRNSAAVRTSLVSSDVKCCSCSNLCFDGPSIAAVEELLQVAFTLLADGLVDLASHRVFKGLVFDIAEDTDWFWECWVSHS